MLTERLKAALDAVDVVAQLPPDAQNKLAEQIESAVRNALWDAQLDDPQYDDVIAQMIAEAKQDKRLPFPTPADMGNSECEKIIKRG